MNYSVSEDVPPSWDGILSTFITMVQHNVQLNSGVPIDNLSFDVKRGLLSITYHGGDKTVDSYAMFAREMSSTICSECYAPATNHMGGQPKCDNCF